MTRQEILKKQLEQAGEVREHIVGQIKVTKAPNHCGDLLSLVSAFNSVCELEKSLAEVVADKPGAAKVNVGQHSG